MKTRKFLWAVLPMMAAALAMTACGGDDDTDTKPVPVSPTDNTDKTEKTEKSIPYTVTVKGDPETTRATVNADGKTMNFADDDELYISGGGDIHGVLTLQSGAGSEEATFSGTLYYEASTPPNSSTSLTATLVSSNNKVADITDDKVTDFTYPTENNVCSTLADAVSQYSQLTGTGNYGSGDIVLYQSTAFLKFTVTLEDGTTGGASVDVSVTSDGSTTIGTGTASTTGSNRFFDIQAVFYVPVAGGTVITKDASMCVANVDDDDESITYGASTNKKLTGGNVYTVSKTKDFVRLWAGGPVWRSKNVGASSVTDYGGYYCWGGKTDVTSTSYDCSWNDNCPYWTSGTESNTAKFKKYVATDHTERWENTESTTPDNKLELEAGDDVAYTITPSGTWRMPKIDEFKNLLSNTDDAGTTISVAGNSVNGRTFTGNTTGYEGKAIFLPAAGYRNGIKLTTGLRYWSSSLEASTSYRGCELILEGNAVTTSVSGRQRGRSVRPVRTN